MKLKYKKIISTLTTAVLTSAVICSAYTHNNAPIEEKNTAPYIVCASAEEADDYEVNVYYIIVDELGEYGEQCQWYTTLDKSFRTDGITIKLNGEDITDKCFIDFDLGVTPPEVYDKINTDYEIPLIVKTSKDEYINPTMPVKIGLEGDVNLDHKVDVRDASAMIRDIEYFKKNSKSQLDEFGLYLGAPENETKAYTLTDSKPSNLAKKLAKNTLKRATGEKLERKNESEYALSLSKACGYPGETVTLQIVVDSEDKFESLDALIEWDDDSLKSAAAVSVNGTLCQSYAEDGMVSIVDYSVGGVGDGAIASIDFVISENAIPGTNLEVFFTDVETFAVYENGQTKDVSGISNIMGASIGVLQPNPITTTATTSSDTSSTTVSTTSPLIAKPIERGDANIDGNVDVRDAAYIAKMLAAGESTMLPDISDYNYDGRKNIRDAAAIALYLCTRFS